MFVGLPPPTAPDPNTDLQFKITGPLTFSGGADAQNIGLGSQLGNTATITNANLGTNEAETAVSATFDPPGSAGVYTMTVTNVSLLADGASVTVQTRLEFRYE